MLISLNKQVISADTQVASLSKRTEDLAAREQRLNEERQAYIFSDEPTLV